MKSEMTRRSLFAALAAPVVAPVIAALVPAVPAAPVPNGDAEVLALIEARMEAAYLEMGRLMNAEFALMMSYPRAFRVLGPEGITEADLDPWDGNDYLTYGTASRNVGVNLTEGAS